jgi:hypothetical protein
MTSVPILHSSCARAATAAEARYRIDAPIAPARGARVIALDERAAGVASRVAGESWTNARFFVCEGGEAEGLRLKGIGGSEAELVEQLVDADVVVMVASEDASAACAHAIGRACWQRSIMTAGIVLGDGHGTDDAVAALRPHARVLLPSADESDVVELLTALRA